MTTDDQACRKKNLAQIKNICMQRKYENKIKGSTVHCFQLKSTLFKRASINRTNFKNRPVQCALGNSSSSRFELVCVRYIVTNDQVRMGLKVIELGPWNLGQAVKLVRAPLGE